MKEAINNHKIPAHWQLKKLGEVCKIIMGQSPPSNTYNKIGDGLPFFQGKAEFSDLHPIVEKWCSVPNKVADVNDILLSVRAPVGATNIADTKCCIGRGLAAIRFENYKYIYYYLKSIEKYLDTKGTGTTFKAISGETLRNVLMPIPPLPEQQAIVAKIEELLRELENGKQQLQIAQQQLKVYRQSLLKWAFEGKLTMSWRESKSDLPTADDLFKQIEDGKERFYLNQLKEWENELNIWKKNGQVGKKPSKPKVPTVPDKPNVQQNEKKWDIPQNWIWTQLGSICFVTKLAGFEYTDYVKYDENGDLPVLKAENVGNLGFKETLYSKVKTDSIKMLTRSQLFGGELIIVFVGAGTGNVAMVPYNHKYFLGPNIGMARPYFNTNSKYLELFYQSIFGKNLMLSAVKAVAQPSLSMGTIRQTPLAFPPIEEQQLIVSELESKLTICDKIEATISQSLLQAETLRQSILKKAFDGKLVSYQEDLPLAAEPKAEYGTNQKV